MGNFESHSGTVLGLDLDALDVDEAYVYFQNNLSNPAYLFSLTDQCVACLPKLEYRLDAWDQVSSVIDTKYDLNLFAGLDTARSNLTRCSNHDSFLEFGVYNCSVSPALDAELTCDCVQVKPGVNIYWPILCCVLFYLGLVVIWLKAKYLWRTYKCYAAKADSTRQIGMTTATDSSSNEQRSVDSVAITEEIPKQTQRIKSIDTFRGIAIIIMIFVNYGGGDYWFFDHSPWNGLTVADLVFPWFMWLMGVCIPISVQSLLRRKSSKSRAFLKIIKRSIYLFVLGLALSNINHVDVQKLRIFGVLQRFGITYLIMASLHLAFLKLNRASPPKKYDIIKEFVDILPQWFIVLMVVAIHLMFTLMLKFEDCPRGYLGPGGRHDAGQYANCTGGVTGYIDRAVMGAKHLYQYSTEDSVFDSPLPFDPEGIMGTFQAFLTVFLGVQAGMIIVIHKNHKDRIIRWLVWAIVTGVIGALLCKASKDDGWIPINKNLWSVSFVLVTASLAFLVLAFIYYVVDVRRFCTGAPFFYPGMNAILLYVGHQLTDEVFPWRWMDSSSGSAVKTHGYQLIVDLWGTTLWVLISVWLYHIKFFLAL